MIQPDLYVSVTTSIIAHIRLQGRFSSRRSAGIYSATYLNSSSLV